MSGLGGETSLAQLIPFSKLSKLVPWHSMAWTSDAIQLLQSPRNLVPNRERNHVPTKREGGSWASLEKIEMT